MKKRAVIVNDKMQKRFRYVCTASPGKNFDREFKPELTPEDMLRLGIFSGKYMTDCKKKNFLKHGLKKPSYARKSTTRH